MNSAPDLFRPMPSGWHSVALCPKPSREDNTPLPTMVVTVVPLGLITLTLLELYSLVKTLPKASTATPVGRAQGNPPARLLEKPAGVTLRNLLLLYSAMYTLPRVSTARRALPVLKVGAAPSTAPAVGLPTQVETFHCTGASLQGHRAQAEAPTLLERPPGQGVHWEDPASAAKVPAGQGRAGAPLLPPGQKNPGAQAVQVRFEGAMKNPGAHGGKGEGVGVAVLLRVAVGVAVGVAEVEVVGVHVESGVLEPLRVGVGEGVGEGE